MNADEFVVETPYNTRWWDKPFGRVANDAFFSLSKTKQTELLSEFDVVEYAGETSNDNKISRIAASGFWCADMQIPFQLNLRAFKSERLPSYLSNLNLIPATEAPFALTPEDMPVFQAERFWQLSGISPEQLARRYAFWSNDLVSANPDLSFQAFSGGHIIGWFLGRRLGENKVELTLAMTRANSGAVGGYLYEAAMYTYAAMGLRLGQAAFSARNVPVMNIYSRLGARFEMPRMIWMWQNGNQ